MVLLNQNEGSLRQINFSRVEATYFSGATAAQSSPFHLFDLILGVSHSDNFLAEQQVYMPREHQLLLKDIASTGITIKKFLDQNQDQEWHSKLSSAFVQTIEALEEFRTYHIQIVTRYIVSQSASLKDEKGTGGSSLIPFLKQVRADSSQLKLNNT